MQDIANEVNLQKASLYHHFSSKQEILFELLDQALDVLISRMYRVLNVDLNSVEKLELATREYLNTIADNRDFAAVLLLDHRALEVPLREKHLPKRDEFEHIWRDIIAEGVEQGQFNCKDPALAARGLLGTLNWTITWFNPKGKLNPTELADHLSNIFLNGLYVRNQ